jgi:hypothetical protein
LRTLVLRQKNAFDILGKERPLPAWGGEAGPSTDLSNRAGSKHRITSGKISQAKRLKVSVADDGEDMVRVDQIGLAQGSATITYASEEEDPEVPTSGMTHHDRLNGILKRMTAEMMLKVPSPQKIGSWRRITEAECGTLTFKTLCDSKQLPKLLVCWRQVSNPSQWNTVVEKIFPTLRQHLDLLTDKNGRPKGTFLQGLAPCSFYQDWVELQGDDELPQADREALLKLVRKKVNDEVQWLPLGQKDRLWCHKGAREATIHREDRDKRGGVVVVLNPKFCKDVDIPGGY